MRRLIAGIVLASALSTATGAVLAQSNDAPPAPSTPAPFTSAPSAPSTPDSVAPNKETRAAIATAQAKLAWQLIKDAALGVDPTISPAGLASVFSVLSDGADTKMKSAIVKAMGFESSADAKLGLAALSSARQNATTADPAVFVSKDLIVFEPTAQPSPIFLAGLGALNVQYYVDDLSKMEAVKKIDGWVNETTKGAIPEILGQPLWKPDLVALNALHFKAKWATTFDPKVTVETPFTNVDKKSVKVMMMHLPEAQQSFRQDNDLIGIDLPFAGERFSLIVVTSTKAPKTVREFSEAATWLSGDGFAPHKGDIALPRFSLQASSSLLPALEKAGLGDGLKSPFALAAFGVGARLTQVVQRAMIDFDEEGETDSPVIARGLQPEDDAYHMVVDKPFLFALRDRQSGLILVAGYVGHVPGAETLSPPRRVALVVANSAYPLAPLTNPPIDAGIIEASLEKIGFSVVVKKDLDIDAFEQAIADFAETARGADLALFYFAGHGFSIAADGRQQNLLMSTSANFAAKTALALQGGGEPLEHVEETIIGHARATLIFIDACRNVPVLASRGVGSRGFAPIDSSNFEGAYVVLSTRQGKTADDGLGGQGSPFARAFASVLPTPGLRIEDAYARIREKVRGETSGEQVPDVVRSDLPEGGVVLTAAPAER